MKTKYVFYAIVFLFTSLLISCGENNNNRSTTSETVYQAPAPKTRIDGVRYFYNNFDEFDICLGDSYGCHTIKSVSFDGDYMKVTYSYKNGTLHGSIEPNGSFTGTYKTSSTSGDFSLRFDTDGSATGSWNTTSSFIEFSGPMSFE